MCVKKAKELKLNDVIYLPKEKVTCRILGKYNWQGNVTLFIDKLLIYEEKYGRTNLVRMDKNKSVSVIGQSTMATINE